MQILNPPKADTPANLVLRPEDVMARPIQSMSCPSNNVLLKVTVPKWTGRKRKRGSDEPFTDAVPEIVEEPSPRRTSKDLLRSLQDNASKYKIETVGKVERTHVFRGMFKAFCQ
jgi:general transcription factor 3C polypeptide 5 (transcription factor C subunit 1)